MSSTTSLNDLPPHKRLRLQQKQQQHTTSKRIVVSLPTDTPPLPTKKRKESRHHQSPPRPTLYSLPTKKRICANRPQNAPSFDHQSPPPPPHYSLPTKKRIHAYQPQNALSFDHQSPPHPSHFSLPAKKRIRANQPQNAPPFHHQSPPLQPQNAPSFVHQSPPQNTSSFLQQSPPPQPQNAPPFHHQSPPLEPQNAPSFVHQSAPQNASSFLQQSPSPQPQNAPSFHHQSPPLQPQNASFHHQSPPPPPSHYSLPAKKRIHAYQPQNDVVVKLFDLNEEYKPSLHSPEKKPPEHKIDDDDDGILCCVCDSTDANTSDPIVFCDGCNLMVHASCYGFPLTNGIPEGDWFCERCRLGKNDAVCSLCPIKEGAMKETTDGKWAHLVCALLIPEVFFLDCVGREGIDCSKVPKKRWLEKCYVCGFCGEGCVLECSEPKCGLAFHVTCGVKEEVCFEYNEGKKKKKNGAADVVAGFCKSHSELWEKVSGKYKIVAVEDKKKRK